MIRCISKEMTDRRSLKIYNTFLYIGYYAISHYSVMWLVVLSRQCCFLALASRLLEGICVTKEYNSFELHSTYWPVGWETSRNILLLMTQYVHYNGEFN